ncbi:DoxX family membrane protein [Arthrobacter cavernae]|uniref:DoxX family membrane protein n=1 Tax=Arthrobacter cavernae TaxID=2817681 RepID=A0A939KL31_9MICC|nr:DoxX family membrane protein [Arthrobacter cavernae]MBO1269519.1 DoxX family membrane protein [Arthrobacter cavernae]
MTHEIDSPRGTQHPDRIQVPITVAERARALDHSVTQALRPVALPALRVMLGILFLWFGGLKVIGRSPVAGLIGQTLPFGNDHLVLLLLGLAELALGALLISGMFIRLSVLASAMHLAGTFSTFAMAPELMFSDGNPLLLTTDGEFVTKNGLLIAATLVLITHTSRPPKGPKPEAA